MTRDDELFGWPSSPWAGRSRSGHGRPVRILLACPAAEGQGFPAHDVFMTHVVEDYAEQCNWPLVVKVTPDATRADVVTSLRWLIAQIERYPAEWCGTGTEGAGAGPQTPPHGSRVLSWPPPRPGGTAS